MRKTMTKIGLLGGLAALLSLPAMAQTAGYEASRDANQQRMIQQGLQNGSLSTGEAARLEQGESRIDRMQSAADRNGSISAPEAARINRAQDAQHRAIAGAEHNDVRGNPNSPSSRRMQADVARDAHQQQRIANGVQNGQLTNREAGRMEHREAHLDRRESRAGRDGHVGPHEQHGIQRQANRDSRAIHHDRHDDRVRG